MPKFAWKTKIVKSVPNLEKLLNTIADGNPTILLDPGSGEGWQFIVAYRVTPFDEEIEDDEAPV